MISSRINIFVDENEFDFGREKTPARSAFKLDSETSVLKQKAHYFDTLSKLGEVVRFNRADATVGSPLAAALAASDSMVASFHEPPPELPCRLLQHTKGGLMLPEGFLGKWTFDHPSTVSIVTSSHQASRITRSFANLPLHVFPFYPTISSVFLEPNEAAVEGMKDGRNPSHLVYGGRWIANKGLCQLVRALKPRQGGVKSVEFIGEFEPDFPLSQSGGTHINYPEFHAREVLQANPLLSIWETQSLPAPALASRFRRATAFAYLSFHEDENYGLAPREAAACGAAPVLTDWCGLGEFGRSAHGGIVRTWPTLGGIRYSLTEALAETERVMGWTQQQKNEAETFNRAWVASECSGANSIQQMGRALQTLLGLPAAPPPDGGWRCPSRVERLIAHGPSSFKNALSPQSVSAPKGLYVEGLGRGDQPFSEASFFAAIQGLYTTWPGTPKLLPGVRLHSFWRAALWNQERALVEFGYPGPRVLRFTEAEWQVVSSSAIPQATGDLVFDISDGVAVEVFQRTIELGYLVPDDPMQCDLPEPLDFIPSSRAL